MQDAGRQWTHDNNGLPFSTVESVTYHPREPLRVYALSFGKLYCSNNGGTTWDIASTDFESLPIHDCGGHRDRHIDSWASLTTWASLSRILKFHLPSKSAAR